MTKTLMQINFQMPIYSFLIAPNGFLTHDKECHALWHYYTLARRNYEEEFKDTLIIYEGDPDPVYNNRQLFMSIATAYGVQPERMIKFWKNVDMQCTVSDLPKLPDEDRFRFNHTPEIKSQ